MGSHLLSDTDPARLHPGDAGLTCYAAPEPGARPDIWPAGFQREAGGEVAVYGIPVCTLLASARARTPVFLMNLTDFKRKTRAFKEAFDRAFGEGNSQVHYAGKAFLTLEVARAATEQGLGLDTASPGELSLALASGCEPGLIGLHGNGKSADLLHQALTAGIGRIIVDSISEIVRLQRVLDEFPQASTVPLMVRLNTGVHAGGHDFIATAHEDQKFGLSPQPGTTAGLGEGEGQDLTTRHNLSPQDSPAMAAVKLILSDERLDLTGLHSHIGSQITDFAGFRAAAQRILEFRGEIQKETGYLVDEIDLGGGYGVAYTQFAPPAPAPEDIAQALYQTVQKVCGELDQPLPFVSVEPGRSLVASTAVMLYRVRNVKDQPLETKADGSVFYRRYISVDGGMSDNIRPALYGADYTALLANRTSASTLVACRVVGSHCESGDVVVSHVALPADVDEGDILAVPMVGAYGWSMSSNYNWFTRPGVLGVELDKNGTPSTKWLLEPETIETMLAHFDPAYRLTLPRASIGKERVETGLTHDFITKPTKEET